MKDIFRQAAGSDGGGAKHRIEMKRLIFVALAMMASSPAWAATVVNTDKEQHTIVVTEGSQRSELVIAEGETVEICAGGCFVTMPNGDREALKGDERIEISGGQAVFK